MSDFVTEFLNKKGIEITDTDGYFPEDVAEIEFLQIEGADTDEQA